MLAVSSPPLSALGLWTTGLTLAALRPPIPRAAPILAAEGSGPHRGLSSREAWPRSPETQVEPPLSQLLGHPQPLAFTVPPQVMQPSLPLWGLTNLMTSANIPFPRKPTFMDAQD